MRDLLQELNDRWAEQSAPIARYLLPGATEQELDEAEKQLGFPLSAEVRDWYGWHNGYDLVPGLAPQWPSRKLPGSLKEAVRDHHASRAQAREFAEEAGGVAEWNFGATWVALTRPGKQMVVADNDRAGQDSLAPSALRLIIFDEPEKWNPPRLPSLMSLLEAWLTLTQQGTLRFNPTVGDWEEDWSAVPQHLRVRGLIL
ncbi:SMI1/KNR4 family protein [Kineosporia sp. NBRC 101677]|uniref:SMI1/KNR4 family protein n=1 Tax=Kineosporia sp. NBRC 101677 TaxID=3032197 RepID=UPI002552D4D8|nr:SMI1/KNR4 family protein [Kineosporia sp. NBRC 101677]